MIVKLKRNYKFDKAGEWLREVVEANIRTRNLIRRLKTLLIVIIIQKIYPSPDEEADKYYSNLSKLFWEERVQSILGNDWSQKNIFEGS